MPYGHELDRRKQHGLINQQTPNLITILDRERNLMMDQSTENVAADVPAQRSEFADLIQANKNDAFAFTEQERLILELYDQEQELQLEGSLFEAQAQGILEIRWHSNLT